jgi:hypothetical protein
LLVIGFLSLCGAMPNNLEVAKQFHLVKRFGQYKTSPTCCISPKWLFFYSPRQSSHGHLHTPQSTHQRGAVMPAMPHQPAISAAEKSTITIWPKSNSGVQQARPRKTPQP